MEASITSFQPFFGWLLQATLSASLVICLILVAQKILGSKLGPRWCHALWLVLVLRLVMPGVFPNQVNLLSLVPSLDRPFQEQQASVGADGQEALLASQVTDRAESKRLPRSEQTAGPQEQSVSKPGILSKVGNKSKPWVSSLRRILPFVWLAGALAIGVYILLSNFFLWRIVRRERLLLTQKTLELFEECKERMGVKTIVGLVPSTQIKSPALFGFIRPRLLLPMDMLEVASQEELQYVFLHELAHLKRHDIYVGWMISLLQILHWFNPLVWFAFYRMRADRELSCDALVLSRTGKEKSQEYGQVIVGLLRRFSQSRPLPAMAGILENKSQLKRRITMISQFKTSSYQWSPLAVFLILAVSFVSFSFAIGEGRQSSYLPESEPSISLRRAKTGPMSDFSGPPSLDGRYMCDIRPTPELTIAEMVVCDLETGEFRPLTKVSRAGMWGLVISPDSQLVAYMNQFYPSPETELQLINLDGTGHRTLHRFEQGEQVKIHAWISDGKQILCGFWDGEQDQLVSFSIEDGSMQVIHVFDFIWNGRSRGRAISPDGRYFAYDLHQEGKPENRDIYILDLNNQKTEHVVRHGANDRLFGWTPDNKYLLFSSDRKRGYSGAFSTSDTSDAYLLPVADGKRSGAPELIKRDIPAKIRPKGITRDGTFYYAVEFSTIETVVAEVDMKAGELLSKPQIIGQTGTDVTPAWSPDGRYLAYGIQRPDDSQTIHIRDTETGQEREIDPELPYFFSLRWSSDGKSILISTLQARKSQAVFSLDVDSGACVALVQSDSTMLGAAQLSQDGGTLLYVAFQPGTRKASLLARNMETNQEKNLFSMENAMGAQGLNFALSPDGQQLALATFERWDSPMRMVHHILTMPVQGGELKELLRNEDLKQYPLIDWTPDGQFLLFSNSHIQGRPSAVWRIPAGGGEASELCRPQPMMYGVLWSSLDVHPDGKRIAFDCFEYRHEVWAMGNFLPSIDISRDK